MHRFAVFGFPERPRDCNAVRGLRAGFRSGGSRSSRSTPETRAYRNRFHLPLGVAEQLPDPGVVKEQTTILVDDVQAGGTMIENLPELPLVLGALRPHALAAR